MSDSLTLFRLPTEEGNTSVIDRTEEEVVDRPTLEAKRRWATAAWFGIATYQAWSPLTAINKLLPAGSTIRGLALTIIPLAGVVAILRQSETPRHQRVDLLVVVLGLLTVWEAISVEANAGFGFFLHVFPSVALLTLAVVARTPIHDLSVRC